MNFELCMFVEFFAACWISFGIFCALIFLRKSKEKSLEAIFWAIVIGGVLGLITIPIYVINLTIDLIEKHKNKIEEM